MRSFRVELSAEVDVHTYVQSQEVQAMSPRRLTVDRFRERSRIVPKRPRVGTATIFFELQVPTQPTSTNI